MTFPIYGKIKNVPNHQPVTIVFICIHGVYKPTYNWREEHTSNWTLPHCP
jgi:hypothetical protein